MVPSRPPSSLARWTQTLSRVGGSGGGGLRLGGWDSALQWASGRGCTGGQRRASGAHPCPGSVPGTPQRPRPQASKSRRGAEAANGLWRRSRELIKRTTRAGRSRSATRGGARRAGLLVQTVRSGTQEASSSHVPGSLVGEAQQTDPPAASISAGSARPPPAKAHHPGLASAPLVLENLLQPCGPLPLGPTAILETALWQLWTSG